MLAGLFYAFNSQGQTAPTNSLPTRTKALSSNLTNVLVRLTESTNRVGLATHPVTNDVTRASSLPTAKTAPREPAASEAPGVFTQGVPAGVEARLDRYERMNGHKLFDFDGSPARRRSDWLKSPAISPQYRWDAFQNGKPPPRAFRDGITSTYFD